MLPGETLTGGGKVTPCDFCGCEEFPLRVMQTCGYYVGTACKQCGCPNSRETGYFKTKTEAEAALGRIKRADLSDTRAFKEKHGT